MSYPCPACGTMANLAAGCPGCGRRPDPEAAEVIQLDETIRRLDFEVERSRLGYAEAVGRLTAAQRRRGELVARIQARVTGEKAIGQPAAAPQPEPRPARPETSGRTVQNLLFILGGLLLASAAIVFTAVAWANFGVTGRAGILGAVTVLALAIPPVAQKRRLAGTAETFAALGLLLVLLDGYAAWYVNLAGVHALAPTTYAGIICAITAGVALVYGLATHLFDLRRPKGQAPGSGLVGPRFAALAVAQPVVPLLAARAGFGPAGWAGVLAAVTLADLAVARWSDRRASVALRIAAWSVTVAALVSAAYAAFAGLATVAALAPAVRAGLALVLVAAVLVAVAWLNPARELRDLAAGGAALAVLVAAARVTVIGWPYPAFALVAAEITALAAVVRVLPDRVRTGPRLSILVGAAVLGVLATARALAAGLVSASAALPAWHAALGSTADRADWRLPVAVALLCLAAAVLLGRAAVVEAAVSGAVLVALATPAAVPLRWWAPSLVDGLVAVPLAVAAVSARLPKAPGPSVGAGRPAGSARRTVVYGGAAAMLATHAVATGLARPVSTVWVLATLIVIGALVAWRGLTGSGTVGAMATGAALLAMPGLAAAVAAVDAGPVLPCAVAGLIVTALSVAALRRWWPGYATAGAVAVHLAGAGTTIAALAGPTRPFGVYAALALLCDVVAIVAVRPALRRTTWAVPVFAALATVAAGPALAAVTPAVWSLLAGPYAQLGSVWSGRPVALSELDGGYAFAPAAAGLALLTVALLATARWWRPAVVWATLPGVPAILVTAAASHAPWPTVPALSLALGLGAALAWALSERFPALAGVAVVAAGGGLAGALATKPATLTALGATLVTAVVCGVAGRGPVGRASGWLVSVASAAALALATALAADLAVRWAALWVLGAGAVALAASAVLGRRAGRLGEARLVEAAAHATALVALLLTIGAIRYTATVCTLWGVALGVRALWPAQPAATRRTRVGAALGAELIAYWLILVAGGVTLLEAYTLPAAGVALAAGWLAARTRPSLHSWSAYGAGLLAGFGPSVVTLLVTGPGEPARRLGIGVAGVLVVVAGSIWRRQAPVVVGGAALVAVALHEIALVWDLLPRWIPLAAGGLLLVGLAMTYERRRRDVVRLRESVARMH
jgi:hypothetical protein